MTKVGAKDAAELTGKSKSTIQRAMNNGKISYQMDTNGRRVVDVSELERVFGLKKEEKKETQDPSQIIEMERLKMQVKMLEKELELANAQVSDLKEQRDQWQKQASQVLLTSQYSQKQAEDLREQLEARKKKAKQRRQKMLEKKMHSMRPDNQNTQDENYGFNFSHLWKRNKTTA